MKRMVMTWPHLFLDKCPVCDMPLLRSLVIFNYKGVPFKVHDQCRHKLKVMLRYRQYRSVDILLGLDEPTPPKPKSFLRKIFTKLLGH